MRGECVDGSDVFGHMGRTGPVSGGELMWRPLYEKSGLRFRVALSYKTIKPRYTRRILGIFRGFLVVLFNLDEMIIE